MRCRDRQPLLLSEIAQLRLAMLPDRLAQVVIDRERKRMGILWQEDRFLHGGVN